MYLSSANFCEQASARIKSMLPTSSTREGRIFRVLRPSENLSRTLVKPFMKEIFSSRVFEANVDRSKKFNVDIESDEKNGCVGRDVGAGLFTACLVINRDRRSGLHR